MQTYYVVPSSVAPSHAGTSSSGGEGPMQMSVSTASGVHVESDMSSTFGRHPAGRSSILSYCGVRRLGDAATIDTSDETGSDKDDSPFN